MAQVFGDRVLETTTVTSGNVTLLGATSGFRAFSTVATANGDRFVYTIVGGTEWEVGLATRLTSTTFSRDTVYANSAGGTTPLTFTGGTKDVWLDAPARHMQMAAGVAQKNYIINGGMMVNQFNPTGLAQGNYIVDMFSLAASSDATMNGTQQFYSQSPTGFVNSLLVTVSLADLSIGAAQFALVRQKIEGTRSAPLRFGQADASAVTLGFWTKHNPSGTYTGAIQNSAQNRSFTFEYTQIVASTWEYKTVTIPGDTTGTWLITTGVGLNIDWCLACGSNFQAAAGSWTAADRRGTANQVNVLASTSNSFQITGVSLTEGVVPPTSEMSVRLPKTYEQELQACQRYYAKMTLPITDAAMTTGICFSTTGCWGHYLALPVTMRAVPSVSMNSIANFGIASGAVLGNVVSQTWTASPEGICSNDIETDATTFTAGFAAVLIDNGGGAGVITADARFAV